MTSYTTLISPQEIDSEADAVAEVDGHGNPDSMPAILVAAHSVKHAAESEERTEDRDAQAEQQTEVAPGHRTSS
jgi:hypothetical protein